MKGSRNLLLAGAVAAILSPVQAAMPAEADTSEWKCEQCPFPTGSEVTARLGGGNVSDSSAKFGEYNGLDEEGGYVIADVEGRTRLESGWFLDYEGHKLGLDTRDAAVTMGKEGLFSARLFYDAIAKRTFDDTASPFAIGDDGRLTLPSSWVRGATTGQMTQLNALLRPVDIGHERKAAGAEFDVRLGKGIGLFASFRREDKEGTGYAGAGNFTTALQLPEPIDSSTDSYEFGVKWDGASAYARLSYYVQKYDNDLNSITWDNPYVAFNGATTGRMATAPDNESEQILLSAGVRLALDTSLAFKAVIGTVSQDEALLPYTTTTALSPGALPRSSLNGDLDIAHYALSLASRPFDKVRVRGSARIDERKDKTKDITFANGYVESDMGAIPGAITPERYDYTRHQGEIEGEYALLDRVGLFVGARGEELKRTEQDVDKTTEGTGYSGIRLMGYGGATMVLRIGESHRDADDTRTPEAWENPSFWKYNLANRDRDFGDIRFSWAAVENVTVSLDGTIANDIYRRSPYGLKEGSDRRGAANITWMPQEGLSIYLDGGYQQVKALQTNVSGASATEWRATHKDVYKTLGGGAKWTAANDKYEISLDLAEAKSDGAITTETGTASAFPRNTSDLKAARLAGWYKLSDSLRIGAAYRYEKLETADWALQGVDPAAVPTLLALGADPYNYKVNVFSLTLRYDFGPKPKKE